MPVLTIYIDEAGDPGVRDGLKYIGDRHEWLCLSAIVVASGTEPLLTGWVREMRQTANSRQAGSLHYHRITAARRTPVCQVLAGKPLRAFVLASHKSNLREYVNPRIQQMIDAGKFYNFCIRLLLERVTAWCEAWFRLRSIRPLAPLEIVFATRGGHDYAHFFAYIDILRMQADAGILFLRGPGLAPAFLDRSYWRVEPAETRAGLQIADTIASAFYQAANAQSPTWDLEPARTLRPIMAKAKDGMPVNRGVTVWPLPHQAALPADAREIFEDYGYLFADVTGPGLR